MSSSVRPRVCLVGQIDGEVSVGDEHATVRGGGVTAVAGGYFTVSAARPTDVWTLPQRSVA